jgi:hypothetical protein
MAADVSSSAIVFIHLGSCDDGWELSLAVMLRNLVRIKGAMVTSMIHPQHAEPGS